MRKTQNFLRRAGSAALALTLTVSLCQPAFAATKAPFSKDETVYAVMAADGSVTKTTVSEHLYNADGLAGVEDRSTLKNIVNTESFAEYTRNGDTLVWNTDDTDVYYKGDTDRQLPISAKVTYTLDGRTAPLSELLGQSGHLVLTIDLTNHETGKMTVNGKERTIVTPLVTAVGVVLGDDASNVNAVNGLLESAAKSSVAAFVTLPGVKESLDGLLPEQVNGFAEYLQDSVTVEADVESLTAPQILLACAASAEALGQGDEVFDLDSLNDLTDGIAALNDAMNQLLDGASQLKAGAAQLAAGSLALLDGANQLDSGLGQLTEGLDTLTSNNAALTSGAQQVADGVLDSASQTLMENGLIDTPMTWDTYEAVIDDILSLGDKTLAAGRKKMVRTIWEQAPQFKASQLDIKMICPLHGPVWRNNIKYIVDKYIHWATYEPEEKGVLLVYASMYGNTESTASVLAAKLAEKGMTNIHMYDVSKTDISYLISDAFKYSHLVLASVNYNLGIYPKMLNFLEDMKALNLQKRIVGIIENGSWACTVGGLMTEFLENNMKAMTVLQDGVTINSRMTGGQERSMNDLVDAILNSMKEA